VYETFELPAGSDFQRMTEPYRHELLVHCYRFFGSVDDAEDALQETFLRAWRRLDTLKDPAALRAWLYRIATNVCLDLIDYHKSRSMPSAGTQPYDPEAELPAPLQELVWLEPLPGHFLQGQIQNPEVRYEIQESVKIAFLTVLQELPSRQRAVLILRDVLGWKSQEVAGLLDLSVAAVNSALQRARETMKKYQREDPSLGTDIDDPDTRSLLDRYVLAWEKADPAGLVSLLREDAILTMPPSPAWYQGRPAIRKFLETHLFTAAASGRFRLTPVQANGCPAFAIYQLDEAGAYRANAVSVLDGGGGQISRLDSFLTFDGKLFARFGLPLFL
jgi:RNA polymerase sigma-70 factor (ECF subfamily)